MRQLVECVPNFSEGRRLGIVDQIVAAITSVEEIQLLDRESDADHNRSVITYVGPPEAVLEAAFRGIQKAAELIDMDAHQGAHPRLGATDVVPFIPLEGLTLADCVILAKRLGQRVGDELNIPVYLYEAAATRPEYENLANVRKGEYETLKGAIVDDPNRKPDYGPSVVGKAGATIIGARAPLIAYNVYLTTDDVDIAKHIARAIRHQTGGLRFVKALGLLVDGKAQVSMNLTNYAQTPIFRVVELIRREAARYGVGIQSTELVGLIPQQALFDAAQWYLQIDNFKTEQVLETRLTSAPDQSSFLNALASAEPTPGGGSAAAYAGAMAAALVAMVARVTIGKKKYAEVEARMMEIVSEAEKLRADLEAAVQKDADAFNSVMAAMKLPKETDEQRMAREQAIENATLRAAEVPLHVALMALKALELIVEVAQMGNVNAVSDAGSAGSLASTAIYAASLNVKINVNGLVNKEKGQTLLQELATIQAQARNHTLKLHAAIRDRGGIEIE